MIVIGEAAVGADHNADLAEWGLEHGRLAARCVAHGLVFEHLFVVFAEEIAGRADERGSVVTGVTVGLQHPGDQMGGNSLANSESLRKYSPWGIGSPSAR